MTKPPTRAHAAAAGLLALLLMLVATAGASAQPQRFRSTEHLAYRLINCLRTGGLVTPGGSCKGYGSGRFSKYRKPLAFSQKISNKVAWPYAGRVATTGRCQHDLGGVTTDKRFRTVGLRHERNGENLACRWVSSPRQMVVYWIRHWYRETSYGGPHWRQIKEPDFRSVGLGVARHRSGRMSLVVNFYGKPVP